MQTTSDLGVAASGGSFRARRRIVGSVAVAQITAEIRRPQKPHEREVASLDRKCLGAKMPGRSRSADGRDIFDEETRRKPLAFAADAGETSDYRI